jgi:hypothetical protein
MACEIISAGLARQYELSFRWLHETPELVDFNIEFKHMPLCHLK